MKWIPKISFLWIAVAVYVLACNPKTQYDNTKAPQDSTATIPPEITPGLPEFPGMKNIIGNNNYINAYRQQMGEENFMASYRVMKVDMLSNEFTPKEVFLEILRRTGRMRGDTLPKAFRKYYSWPDIQFIKQKNKRLSELTDLEAMDVYRKSSERVGVFVIRGDDDREEVFYNINDLSNPSPTRRDMCNARCVAAAFPSYMLDPLPGGGYTLANWETFRERYTLCPNERFNTEPATADFSAFVVNDSTLITAGHCLDSLSYKNYYFVFDYIVNAQHQPPKLFPESIVYKATSIIRRYDTLKNEDLCIIRMNKRIDARRIPVLNEQSAASYDNHYYVIGSPGGLPLKLAGKAKIMENSNPAYFLVNSDTYGGNSGSPVFNTQTDKIEGYLVNGANDFDFDPILINCKKSVVCPYDECQGSKGEKVIRTSQFIHLIK